MDGVILAGGSTGLALVLIVYCCVKNCMVRETESVVVETYEVLSELKQNTPGISSLEENNK